MSKVRFYTLAELCDLLGIGKQTYYKLQREGYFPEPVRSTNGRVFFSQELVEECQTIVRTRCGKNGLPLSLNRRPGAAPAPKKKASAKHEDLITALASLGVQTTPAKVQAVLDTLPKDMPEGELIKAVFRELKKSA
jgi:predicted DNA-binding transcriptional regulator AlpA